MLANMTFDLADVLLVIAAIDKLIISEEPLDDDQKMRLRHIVSRITDPFPDIKYEEPIQIILARLETKSA